MRRWVLSIVLGAQPCFAIAQDLDCHFTLECLSGEACQSTAFEAKVLIETVDLPLQDGVTIRAPLPQMVTPAETILFLSGQGQDSLTDMPNGFISQTGDRIDHLTIAMDRTALYTMVLKNDGFSATYLGHCEVVS